MTTEKEKTKAKPKLSAEAIEERRREHERRVAGPAKVNKGGS